MITATSNQTTTALTGVVILATAVWVGGLVAILIVTRAARSTLSPDSQVVFFRAVGRSYGPVSSAALVVALGVGATLLSGRSWSGLLIAAIMIATALVVTTVYGVAQARRMSNARQQALSAPNVPELAERVRHGARNAAALRALIGALSLALLAIGVALAS